MDSREKSKKINNIIQFPRRMLPPTFFFSGCGVSIQVDKIKEVYLVFCEDHKTKMRIPSLHVNLIDESVIITDYDSIEEAEEVMEIFYKCMIEDDKNNPEYYYSRALQYYQLSQ